MGNQTPKMVINERVIQVNNEAKMWYGRLLSRSSDTEFTSRINDFRKNGTFCDVVIKVNGKTFKAHKIVLAAVSDIFKEHFSKNSSSEVELGDVIPSSVFEMALDWTYGESVLVPILHGDFRLPVLMDFAGKMKVPSLVSSCGILMSKILDDNNCFIFYENGRKHHHDILRKAAMEFIQKDFKTLCHNDDFLKLSPKGLKELFDDGFFGRNVDVAQPAAEKWLANRKNLGGKVYGMSSPSSEGSSNVSIHVKQYLPEQNAEGLALIGGVGKNTTVTGFLSIEKGRLYILAPPPFQLSNLRIASSGKYIYAQSVDRISKCPDLWRYKASSNQWGNMNKGAPVEIAAESLFELGEVLYLFGADRQNKTVWSYELGNRIWTSHPALQVGVHAPETVAVDGMLYLIGEEVQASNIQTFQRFDPQSGNTKLLDKFPVSAYRVIMCSFKNDIFAFDGGKPDEPFDERVVFVYKTSTERWELISPLHKMKKRPDALVVLGGVVTLISIEGSQTVTCQQYSPSTNSWKIFSKAISVEPLTLARAIDTGFVFNV